MLYALCTYTNMSTSYTKEKKKGEVVYVCDLLVVSVRELEYEMKTTQQVTSPKATHTHTHTHTFHNTLLIS